MLAAGSTFRSGSSVEQEYTLNVGKYPNLGIPIMFWTDYECYLLMELARTSPDVIPNLPRINVASDPASTDFFYDRLNDIAQTAKLEIAANNGSFAVLRNIPEDISQKVPMPWHAPGWKNQCNMSENGRTVLGMNYGPKISYWPTNQGSRFMRNTNASFLPSCAPAPLPQHNLFAMSDVRSNGISGSAPPLNEDLIKAQDDFFLAPAQNPQNPSSWSESRMSSMPLLSSMTSGMKRGNNNELKSLTTRPNNGCPNGMSSQGPNNNWMSIPNCPETIAASEFVRATSAASRCGQGRYWPRQMYSQEGNYDTSQTPKMGQIYPNVVRSVKPSGTSGGGGKNHFSCRIQTDGSEGSPTNPSKESYLCVFCKGNNEPEAIYKSHPLRLNNIVICPSLRNYTCCICKATGDNAHTIKYCPFNKRGFFATRSHEKCNSNNNSRIKMKVQIIEGASNASSSLQQIQQDQASELFHQRNFQPIPIIFHSNNKDMDEDDNDAEAPNSDSGDEGYSGPSPMKVIISVEKPGPCKYSRC